MNIMPSIEEQIKEYLKKTGFPTEIKVSRILYNSHWMVHSQYSFLDKIENKLRSVDFKATFSSGDFKSILTLNII